MTFLFFIYLFIIGCPLILHLLLPWKLHFPALFNSYLDHGKSRQKGLTFSVPKRWFRYFYLWGFVWNVYVASCTIIYSKNDLICKPLKIIFNFLLSPAYTLDDLSLASSIVSMETALPLAMICLHLLRRTYESFVVTNFGQSQMDVAHFVTGVLFYTTLSVLVVCYQKNITDTNVLADSSWLIKWYHIPVLLVFLWVSKHQYNCHLILNNLKNHSTYNIPYGDWFECISCPHYFADILIYICLYASTGLSNYYLLLPVLSTVSILTAAARNTHLWYCKRFSNYPTDRKIIFPLIY